MVAWLSGEIPQSLKSLCNLTKLGLYGNGLVVPAGAPLDSDGDMWYDTAEQVAAFLSVV